jgi:TonB family protein
MRRFFIIIRTVIVGIVLVGPILKSVAQNPASPNSPQSEVILTKLAQPVYPPLARQVHISGNVELMLEVRRDGSVQSATAVSGHPLLVQAALDSARRSQFECQKCSETVSALRLEYTFQLVGAESCCAATGDKPKNKEPDQLVPRVVHSKNHITVVDLTTCNCDPGDGYFMVRSLKCLYLWRCGRR